MEIPEIVLSKALKTSSVSSLHAELNSLLKKLEAKTIEEILNGENDDDINHIEQEIFQIINSIIYYNPKSEEETVEELSKIIYTQNCYLKKGIINADLRSILLFFNVNCYLNIDVEYLFDEMKITEQNSEPLTEQIFQHLSKINLEMKAPSTAPYHEKKLLEEAKQGFIDNNIKLTYNLIEAMENGSGMHYNFLLKQLVSFLSFIRFSYFVKLLNSLNDCLKIVFFLQYVNNTNLIRLLNDPLFQNKWLRFELIRKILKNKDSSNEQEKCVAIKNSLLKIKESDFNFLKQTIQYFHSSPLFNASLGELISSLQDFELYEIISDCFVIDAYNFHMDARNKLLEHCNNSSSNQQYKYFLSIVFDKWNSFIENSVKSEDFYLNNLLFTDFFEFVIQYNLLFKSDDEVIVKMRNLINRIKYIDSEWASTASKQLTIFHLYYSQLNLLTFVYKNKNLKDTLIEHSYRELIQNELICLKYIHQKKELFYKAAKENLGIQ